MELGHIKLGIGDLVEIYGLSGDEAKYNGKKGSVYASEGCSDEDASLPNGSYIVQVVVQKAHGESLRQDLSTGNSRSNAVTEDVVFSPDNILLLSGMPSTVLQATSACAKCGSKSGLLKCSRCKLAVYCSKECQAAH